MPKEFKPTPKRARKQPKKFDPATGKPFARTSRPKRRQWELSPDYRPMVLDDTYDPPAED
ncbi:MAG: hypothetical protein ACXVYB_00065 [Arthrobacter sp.]